MATPGTGINEQEAQGVRDTLGQTTTQSTVLEQSMLNMQIEMAELKEMVRAAITARSPQESPPGIAPPMAPPAEAPPPTTAAAVGQAGQSVGSEPRRVPLLEAARNGTLHPPRAAAPGPSLPQWQQATHDSEDLAEIHHKDVAKPVKYTGNVSTWKVWNIKFKGFLMRRDRRWAPLLDAVKQRSATTLTAELESEIFSALAISKPLAEKFKAQLYEYLEEYTEGLTHTNVLYAGANGSLEIWRQLCEEGFSRKDRSLRREYKRVMSPKQATFEHLKRDIAAWESDLVTYEMASGHQMSEKDRLMCLDDMCPTELQRHMDTMAVQVRTYAEFKSEIDVFLQNRKRWGPASKDALRSLQETPDDPEVPEPEGQEDYSPEDAAVMEQCGQLMALVNSKYGKKGKKGKGLGKGGKVGKGEQPDKCRRPAM